MRRISVATRTVTQILDEILEFSKMEAGQTVLEVAPFSLADIFDEVREMFEPKAEEKGIGFDFPSITCNCVLLGDKHRIKQVLSNLISNAIKFTPSGHVCIKTQHQKRGPDLLEEVILDVIDTGIGIDLEVLPTLFNPFTQGDSSITRKFGGTGLGLAISKNLAELMGGKIEAKSAPGLGSSFQFSVDIPIEECSARQEIDKTRAHNKNCLQGLNLLIVDDDSGNIETMGDLIVALGACMTFAYDGLQALEQLQQTPDQFDIVLMDIQMPIMDGIEASKRIRNELHLNTLPIIAVTAGVLPHQQQEAISAGITELIRKPVDHESLIATLLRHRPSSGR